VREQDRHETLEGTPRLIARTKTKRDPQGKKGGGLLMAGKRDWESLT